MKVFEQRNASLCMFQGGSPGNCLEERLETSRLVRKLLKLSNEKKMKHNTTYEGVLPIKSNLSLIRTEMYSDGIL